MGVASISTVIRSLPELALREVFFIFGSSQSGNTIDLSQYGWSGITNGVLLIEEWSATPGTGANLITTSTATVSTSTLTINSASTRLVRVVMR